MTDRPKTAIWIYADLETSPIGTRSRLADDLAGKPVLTRTVNQLSKTKEFDAIVVFCVQADKSKVESLVAGCDQRVEVVGVDNQVKSKYIKLRKWALECWRGGIGEFTQFDEDTVSAEMVNYGIAHKHNVVMVCSAASAVIDPELLDSVCSHYFENQDKMRFTFSQAPPGLCGCMYRLDLLRDIVQSGLSIGNVLTYDPDAPHSDYIVHECTYKVAENIYSCFSRFIADNLRSMILLNEILEADDEPPSAVKLVAYANQKTENSVYEFPREIEIEISGTPSVRYVEYPHTVDDRSSWKCQRSNMDIENFNNFLKKCSKYDDICITFGGFGEPLAHPDIVEFVKAAKSSGIFGVNIETDGLLLTEEIGKQLVDAGVDIVTINIDAWSESTWVRTKGSQVESFSQVLSNIESMVDSVRATNSVVVCSMVKTLDTLADMEPFYDQWRKNNVISIVRGHNNYCGYIEDKNVMNMAPPARFPCNSLYRTLMILADGTIVQCGQDFQGISVCGNAFEDDISSIWQDGFAQLRQSHCDKDFECNELCKNCKEWFR